MSQDFTTRLQLQLRDAALREERRSPLRRWLVGLRHGMPGPAAATAVALAAALVVAVVVAGGLRWGGERPVSHPKVITTFPLADNVGWLASGFGSVWAADTNNLEVLRIDPSTHKVRARIPAGGDTNAFNGDPIINVGAGAVWAIARAPGTDGGSRVLRIDPATNRITARVMLPARQAPLVFDVQIVDGRPWVLTAGGAIELDPQTARPRRYVAIEQPAGEPFPIWTLVSGDELWVLTRERTLDRYDLGSGRKASSQPIPVPSAWAVVPTPEGPVYGVDDGEIARADVNGRLAWQHRLGTMTSIPFVTGGTVWVHASDTEGGRDRLVELDLRSGEVRSSTGLPEFGITGLALVGQDLWISSQNGDVTIVRP